MMLDNQLTMDISSYYSLYHIVVPKTHFLRQLTELCDFSFIYDELEKDYCPDFGRKVYSPIMMFKYLLLKDTYNLSDADVVERSLSDMAFKFFLGLAPENSVIEPSSLTKYRKLRIKDDNLLDILIQKSVQIALEHNLIKWKKQKNARHVLGIYHQVISTISANRVETKNRWSKKDT